MGHTRMKHNLGLLEESAGNSQVENAELASSLFDRKHVVFGYVVSKNLEYLDVG